VTNLVDNALKYNRTGGTVTVTAKRAEAGAPKGAGMLRRRLGGHPPAQWISIAVSDTGAGIPKDDLPRLFDRFYRGDKARVGGGAGLGLSIVDEIVRAHGGRIEVESEPGQGSQFTVFLPVSNGGQG
jgi:signal transduction histidine kinase